MRISRTYEIITPESAENGEAADAGFVEQDADYSFRRLMREAREGGWESSQYPLPDSEADFAQVWLTRYGEADFRTMETENVSIHFAGTTRQVRFWAMIVRAAVRRSPGVDETAHFRAY
jgi:hypothetical protein